MPVSVYRDMSGFKLYMSDNGLYRAILFDKLGVNEGMIMKMRWLRCSDPVVTDCISTRDMLAAAGKMLRK